MYDFFFTKYAVLYYGSKKVSTIWSLASAGLMSAAIYQLIPSVLSNQNSSKYMDTTTYDVVVTILILACIGLLEFIQGLLFWRTFGHLCETNKEVTHARSIRRKHVKPAAVKLPIEVKMALVHSLQRTQVATILSKYCAYLVVSAPKLLPGHHYDSSLMFDAVAVEAAKFLWKVKDKYEALRSLPESTETSILRRGMKLARQFEEMEDDKCWKVLADFWAEMLIYVAPSENVKEHIEALTNGGEFITHWWALLTHAGILERPPRNANNDIENSGEGEGSPYCCPSTTQAAPAACATNQQPMTGDHIVERMCFSFLSLFIL
ncbi:hypothetical protein HU200_065424 [Digitaria exilis]|uniref:DUF4220 domain-containing protein n=1 Tax=Digitaria exilis TaxID=1010633 RepID=A0A835A3W2_9POAL|nr:hypothetical protein HU200_065424 [Digitaria exilis]